MKKNTKHAQISIGNLDLVDDDFPVRIDWPLGFNDVKPLTFMTERRSLSSEHLDALEMWGDLPKVLSVPEAAEFLAAKSKQNPAAIKKILTKAIVIGDLEFFGLSHDGQWVPGMMRVLQKMDGRPRIETEGGREYMVLTFSGRGDRLHVEAMGIDPREGVALLVKRGRKVPAELTHLLPEGRLNTPGMAACPNAGAVKPWQESAREIADHLDRRDKGLGTHDSITGMAERVAVEMRTRGIHGPRGPLSGGTIKREALQGKRGSEPPKGWGKRGG